MSLTKISPSSLQGVLEIPPSKSHTLRAILFATLASGRSVIRNYLHSPDTDAMIRACHLMGAEIAVWDDTLEITGGIKMTEDVIHAGNSGQVLRFVGAVSALMPGYTIITGDHSIRQLRPVQPLIEGLNQLGAFAVSAKGNGFAPLIVRGPLKGGTALVNGEDSQPISALLIASAFAPEKSEIFVTNPGEKPWVKLTLSWFDRLGISYQNESFEKYEIAGGSTVSGFDFTVPTDLSSASYPIAAAVITGSELLLKNVIFDESQGDIEVIFQLKRMGGKIEFDHKAGEIRVLKGSKLKAAKIDVNNFIDGITLLSVVGCYAEGITEIVGGKIARSKESDRIASIVAELKKMGAKIHEKEDGVIVEHSHLTGAALESYSDHRMAMSLAIAALGAQGPSAIEGAQCVRKSFPPFFEALKSVGAKIE